MPAIPVAQAAAAIYCLSILSWMLLHFGRRAMAVAVILPAPFCLLLIPAEHVAARSLTALLCIDAALKVLDCARQISRTISVPRFTDFLWFLVPFPQLLVVYRAHPPEPDSWPRKRELIRLMIGGGVFAVVVVLIKQCQNVSALRENFLLDHTLKFPMFIAAVEGLSQALCAVERLAGFDTTPIVRWSFLSRTPADFWVRYNQRVHEWLYRNVFVPCGGIRAPARGVIVVFLVSAVLHEVMFGIATSRFDGYQFAFFTLQIPAVLASPLLSQAGRSGAWGTVAAHFVTIAWFFVTSMLFLHGGNRALPWFGYYASEPWLP